MALRVGLFTAAVFGGHRDGWSLLDDDDNDGADDDDDGNGDDGDGGDGDGDGDDGDDGDGGDGADGEVACNVPPRTSKYMSISSSRCRATGIALPGARGTMASSFRMLHSRSAWASTVRMWPARRG